MLLVGVDAAIAPLMLKGAEAHTLLFSGTQISTPIEVRTPRQYIDLLRSFTRLSRPPPTSLPPAALPTDSKMSTSDDAGYSGRLRSSTRANQEVQETGRERSRSRPDSRSASRDSRRGGPPDEGSGDDTKDNTRGHRQSTPTDRVDSPVRKEEAEQPPPGSETSRRQLSPARGSTSSWPPRAQQSTTAATWTLRARQSTNPRASGTGAPMPSPTWPWLLRWREPSERSTTQKLLYLGVRYADVATMMTSSSGRSLRERRPWRWRGRAEPPSYQLRRLRRELPHPPRLRRARWVSPPRSHDLGTTPLWKAASSLWRLPRG